MRTLKKMFKGLSFFPAQSPEPMGVYINDYDLEGESKALANEKNILLNTLDNPNFLPSNINLENLKKPVRLELVELLMTQKDKSIVGHAINNNYKIDKSDILNYFLQF